MFIYSFKASTVKLLGIVCVSVVALVLLIVFVPTYSADRPVDSGGMTNVSDTEASKSTSINFGKVKSGEDGAEFLARLGYTVDSGSIESTKVVIPQEFDKVFAAYNEIQREMGLDLTKYKNKELTRYTYKVLNYNGYEGTVYANLLVYRNKVVGGDICSADVKGFIHGFENRNISVG